MLTFDRDIPQAGEFWLHYEDKLAQVLTVGEHPSRPHECTVHYVCSGSPDPRKVYSRTLEDWMATIVHTNGTREPRFRRVPPPTHLTARQLLRMPPDQRGPWILKAAEDAVLSGDYREDDLVDFLPEHEEPENVTN